MRFALRQLAKSPGFSLAAILTLALGIGVNTSMFTLVDVLLFRSAPFPEADRLVVIQSTSPRSQRGGFSFTELEEMRAAVVGPGKAFESLTTYSNWSNTLAEPGQPAERLWAHDATADFFTTYRVQPLLGRAYTAEEQVPGRNRVVVLSHAFWQSRFNGDPGVLGRTLRLNAEPVTIIGVMPPSLTYPLFWGTVHLWRPMTVARHIVDDRHNRYFGAVARLNPGVTAAQAEAQLAPLVAQWARDFPSRNKDRGIRTETMHESTMDSTGRVIVWLLFGLGGSVLLIACTNLANLQLVRATRSARDLAIRSALGATRFRLIWHQLRESMVLALAGGVGGVLVAAWLNELLANSIRIGESAKIALPIDVPVLSAALVMSLLTGVLFGLLPAWFASRTDVLGTLKSQARGSTGGRGHSRARHALIVGEVALALALLGVAGVMIRGFQSLLARDKGWDTSRVLVANIHLPEQSTYNTEDKRRLAIDRLARRLAQIPGAEHTAISATAPTFGYSKTAGIQVEGKTSEKPEELPRAGFTLVASDYFQTLGIPLREGRFFPENVAADSPPVVIIGETLAQKFWPGESALGRRIGERRGDEVVWREVIGVVRDIQFALNLDNPSTMLQIYKPLVHEPWGFLHLLVRGAVPGSFKPAVRRAVTDIDPDVAVQELYTIPESVDRYQHNIIVVNNTLGGFAVLGLVLAALGLYGVISNLVAQRTSEFGIRLALGARPRDLLRLVLRTGVRLTLIGLAIGGVLAFALNRLLASAMPRMAATDPVSLAGVGAVLLAVAMLACWIPARRATRVDPLTALRAE